MSKQAEVSQNGKELLYWHCGECLDKGLPSGCMVVCVTSEGHLVAFCENCKQLVNMIEYCVQPPAMCGECEEEKVKK